LITNYASIINENRKAQRWSPKRKKIELEPTICSNIIDRSESKCRISKLNEYYEPYCTLFTA